MAAVNSGTVNLHALPLRQKRLRVDWRVGTDRIDRASGDRILDFRNWPSPANLERVYKFERRSAAAQGHVVTP
jgi:hypothetical protein